MIMASGKLAGLITDSDLRKRCVAEGVAIDQPVQTIMREKPATISYRATVAQALDKMTALRIRHLPVIKGGIPIGMISLTDIARYQSTNTAFLASDIRKAGSIDELQSISAKLPELQLQLSNAGATPRQIGQAITAVTDALTRRLLEMAEDELGPAPVPYAWMAAGSQGRQEQTSHSDQDNALLIADDMQPEHDEYFAAMAKIVSDGLNSCGFVYCPGDAMATNPMWRMKLSAWKDSFSDWIDHPNPKAMMLASIFFDLRVVEGDQELFQALQDHILAKTREDSIFLAHLAVNVLTHRPPLGFFRNFVLVHDGEHDDTLDIKHRGSVPIIDIARLAVLAEGLQATNTIERLALTSGSASLSSKMGDDLMHALTYIETLRIRHQADLIRQGLPPDNYLRPDKLSGLERAHLKDAFRIIQVMQETLELRYQTTRLS
jgi:CBS domain-containing protein